MRTNAWAGLSIDKGQDRLRKGWICGVVEKAMIGLVLILGLTPRSADDISCPVGNKDKFSNGKSNAPLQSVKIVTCYSLFREGTANAAGKELHEVLINL